jgi:hypothetical protein
MARRCLQRRRTRACDQAVLECIQQAGDRVVSLALVERLSGTNQAQGALAWFNGFRAGFYGAPYVWPLGALDPQVWAVGFIEGRGSRGHP